MLRLEIVRRILGPLPQPRLEGRQPILGARRPRKRERFMEDAKLVPDGAPEVLPDHQLGRSRRFASGGHLVERVQERELRHAVEHLEEPLPLVCAPVGVLVEARVRQRCRTFGRTLERPSPLQEHPLGVRDVTHLDSFAVVHARPIDLLERGKILTGKQREPDLVEERPGGVDEQPRLVPETEGLLRDRKRRFQRHPPEADRPREHHQDLRPQRGVVQPLIEAQGELAELVGGSVVLLDRTDQHGGVQDVRVGGLRGVAMDQREADHRGVVQERQRLVAGQEAGGVQVGAELHDRPHLRFLQGREIDQRADGPPGHELLDAGQLALEGRLSFLGKRGE